MSRASSDGATGHVVLRIHPYGAPGAAGTGREGLRGRYGGTQTPLPVQAEVVGKRVNPFPDPGISIRAASAQSMRGGGYKSPPRPPRAVFWFPGTARVRSPGPSAETFTETALFLTVRPLLCGGRQALPTPLSAAEPCRQFLRCCSRIDAGKLSYSEMCLQKLLK